MKKKSMVVLFIFMSLLLTLSTVCWAVDEREEFQSGPYWYYVNDDGTITISDYRPDDYEEESIEIPSEIDGKVVTRIGNNRSSIFDASQAISIEIPDSVTEIGAFAFSGCYELINIEIPNSVTKIGMSAFMNCPDLTSIELPDSLTTIGGFAFHNCCELTSVDIPDSVIEIGVTEGEHIGDLSERLNPFGGCTSLEAITISSDHEKYEVVDNVLFDKSEKSLLCYPAGLSNNNYSIPYGIQKIARGAFFGCNLKSVEIPDSVTTIGSEAFMCCDNIESIEIPDSVTKMGGSVFQRTNYPEAEPILMIVGKGSYAEQYAIERRIPYTYIE